MAAASPSVAPSRFWSREGWGGFVAFRPAGVAVLLLAGWLGAAPAGRADSWRADQCTTDHGLPSNIIQALAQTPDGFLWIGPPTGLVRCDGVEFVPVNLPEGPVLNGLSVVALAVRGDGRLLAPGGSLFHWNDGRETRVMESPRRPAGDFQAVLEDQNGAVWLAIHGQGWWRLRPRAMETHGPITALPDPDEWSISASLDGGLWASARTGLACGQENRFEGMPGNRMPSGSRPAWAGSVNEALLGDHRRIRHPKPAAFGDELCTADCSFRFFAPDPSGGLHAGGRGGVWQRHVAGNWAGEHGLPPGPTWRHGLEGPAGEVSLGRMARGLHHRPAAGEAPVRVAHRGQRRRLARDMRRTCQGWCRGNRFPGRGAGGWWPGWTRAWPTSRAMPGPAGALPGGPGGRGSTHAPGWPAGSAS